MIFWTSEYFLEFSVSKKSVFKRELCHCKIDKNRVKIQLFDTKRYLTIFKAKIFNPWLKIVGILFKACKSVQATQNCA